LARRRTILLTTSRRPTKNMRTFCRDLSHTFPNIIRINRGKLSLEGLAEKALEYHANKLILVERWKGKIGKIQFFNVNLNGLEAVPPLFYIRSVKLRRDLGDNMPKGRRIRNIAITSSLDRNSEIRRLEERMADFFEIPFFSISEAVKRKYDAVMQISQIHSNHIKVTFQLIPEQVEIGPQIIVSHLVWKLTK